jgi:hypothetical protein
MFLYTKHYIHCTVLLTGLDKRANILITDEPVDLDTERTHRIMLTFLPYGTSEIRAQAGLLNS